VQYPGMELLAHLPLHSLTRLCFRLGRHRDLDFPSPWPELECSSPGKIIEQAFTNLGRCPAWQPCGPSPKVTISLDPECSPRPRYADVLLVTSLSASVVKALMCMCVRAFSLHDSAAPGRGTA
jgi:hypothetical protein